MNKVFISYRTSDGRKDAYRLTEDLNRVFGDDQVFLDKEDLKGGSSWREEIRRAIGRRPVVLVVITADYFGARDDDGLRIDRSDDPVRVELIEAIESGALVIPLLVETVVMPRAESLPEPLRRITECHALKLRSEDWMNDLPRVVGDIMAHGVKPRRSDWRGLFDQTRITRNGRWFTVAVMAFVILIGFELAIADSKDAEDFLGAAVIGLMPLSAAGFVWHTLRRGARWARHGALIVMLLCVWEELHLVARGAGLTGTPGSGSATTVAEAAGTKPRNGGVAATGLDGVWDVEMIPKGPLPPFTFSHEGPRIRMEMAWVDVERHPNIAAMNKISASGGRGIVLKKVQMRGSGTLTGQELNLLLNMVNEEQVAFATGTLTATLAADGRTMTGSYTMIGDAQATPLKLTRR